MGLGGIAGVSSACRAALLSSIFPLASFLLDSDSHAQVPHGDSEDGPGNSFEPAQSTEGPGIYTK